MTNSASIDLDKGAGHSIDPALVPAVLHPLISYVELWRFESLDDQDTFAMSTPAVVLALSSFVEDACQ